MFRMKKIFQSDDTLLNLEIDLEKALERIANIEIKLRQLEENKMARLGLQSPWQTLYEEIKAMFSEDENIRVVIEDDNYTINVFADTKKKAAALDAILKKEYCFGNIICKVRVHYPNTNEDIPRFDNAEEEYKAAFEGNPALSFIFDTFGTMMPEAFYVVFKNKVVQYHNDDLSDVHGNCSTLYQEIAKHIFAIPIGWPVYYNTDLPDNPGKQVNDWK